MRLLFEHLLKLSYWKSEGQKSRNHWEAEIINFRQLIQDELADSPSLKVYLQEIWQECYQYGRKIAAKRSQLPLTTFPETPIATLDQILDEDWLP